MGKKEYGLYSKYIVSRRDGQIDSEAKYFVLRLDTDRHARHALKAYANSVRDDNPKLANDLHAILEVYNRT